MQYVSEKKMIALLAHAGLACGMALGTEPIGLEVDGGNVRDAAHIYYNLASGERVVTLIGQGGGQTSGADTGNSELIWSTQAGPPDCAIDAGYTTAFFFGLDNPGSTALSTAVTLVQAGELNTDTVVDCISINWVVAHPDTDANSDGIGDGVEELAGEWTIWDADDGRAINQSTRLPLLNVLLTDLPGNVFGPGSLSAYNLDLDLGGPGDSTNLSFEIGDSDGDLQGAGFGNTDVDTDGDGIGDGVSVANADRDFDGLPDSDLDGDGLFDWSWSVRFYQPGIGNDFDSDMDSGTAAPTDADTIGISLGFPVGGFVQDDGSIGLDLREAAVAYGVSDRFALYADGMHAGNFDLGGFQCPDVDTPYIPAAIFAFALWGPDPSDPAICPADLTGDRILNFFDISLFIQLYNAGGDFNGDGFTNFFDVSAFIQAYNAGCP